MFYSTSRVSWSCKRELSNSREFSSSSRLANFAIRAAAVIEDSKVYLTVAEWRDGGRPLTPPPCPTGCRIPPNEAPPSALRGLKISASFFLFLFSPLLFPPPNIYGLILSALMTSFKGA